MWTTFIPAKGSLTTQRVPFATILTIQTSHWTRSQTN